MYLENISNMSPPCSAEAFFASPLLPVDAPLFACACGASRPRLPRASQGTGRGGGRHGDPPRSPRRALWGPNGALPGSLFGQAWGERQGVVGCSEKPLALLAAGAAARPSAQHWHISRGGSSGGGPRREGGLAGAVGMAAEAR